MTRPIFHPPPQGPDGSANQNQVERKRNRQRLPVVKFQANTSTVAESATSTTIPVVLNTSSQRTVTVDYTVTGGSATGGGTDYSLSNGTLTFTPGQVMRNITINIVQDSNVESTETITIRLGNPSNAELGAKITHTVSITDDDVEVVNPTVVITSSSASTVDDAIAITITFSAAVTGFDSSDLTLVNCTSSALSGGPTVYTATITPTDEGSFSVTVPAACASHSSGGTNTQSNTLSRTYDVEEEPEPSGTRPLGLNLPGPDDWNTGARLKLCVDVMKTARVISGNPLTGSSKYRVLTTSNRLADYNDSNSHYGSQLPSITGTYLLDCDGGGTVTASGAAVQNVITTGGHTTADIVVSSDNVDVDINFSAAVSNVTLLRPGYARGTTQLTTDEFQTFIAPFSCIRAMNLQNTNWSDEADVAAKVATLGANGLLDWSERPNTTDSWNRTWGAPIEALVQMANESAKDLWLCVPHVASDDYLTGLVNYLHDNLDDGLHCYLEWSNELWNFSAAFHQGGHFRDMALAYIATGDDPQIDDPTDNSYYYQARYAVKRTIDMSNIVRGTYGEVDTVRPIVCSQYANPSYISNALSWALSHYPNPPSYYLYGVGMAPYVGAGTGTSAQIISDIRDDFEDRTTWADGGKMGWWRGIADNFGLNLMMYEAGIDMGQGTTNLTNKIAAAYHADMEQLVLDYYNNCYSNGVVLGCHFLGLCTRDQYGPAWGLTDDVLDLEQPMYLGAVAFTEQDALSGGLTAEYFDGTDFTTSLGTRVVPVVGARVQAWSTTPFKSISGESPTAPNNQSIRYTGKYTVQSGVASLTVLKDANDTANLTVGTPFSGEVDIELEYVANMSGNGTAYVRLMEVDGSDNQTPVAQNSLSPA